MTRNTQVVALAGGLVLMLVSASCSTKTDTRTTAYPPPQDNVTASDRVAPCLNQQGDVTASMDCGSRIPLRR